MRSNERNILLGVAGLLLVAAFWFLVLSPKRTKVDELKGQVATLQQEVEQEHQRVEAGEAAKTQFAGNYSKVVALGKAAPEDSDTASFLVQLNDLAEKGHVDFRSLKLEAEEAGATPPPAQPGLENAPPASSQPSAAAPAAGNGETQTSAPPVPATEAAASTLAIGAGVGPAGLSTLKYKLSFRGSFFDISSFMASVDKLVTSGDGKVSVSGRLSTVDGFSLAPDVIDGFPKLTASLAVTTYLSPPAQGTTAGATPQGPAPSLPGQDPQLAASQGAAP